MQHSISDTMKDLKLKKSISGLTGADCIICCSRQADWMDESQIRSGFPITRSAEDTLQLYLNLTENDTIELPTKKGDYDVRKGFYQINLICAGSVPTRIDYN